jgi:hypothetical protein
MRDGRTMSARDPTAAERQRRKRERRRQGKAAWLVEGDDVAIPEKLIAAGYLDRRHADDPKAIAAALSWFLADIEVADIRAA